MSQQTKGSFVPLQFGTTALTGYVVDSNDNTDTTGELLIENEVGDIVTQITKFGLKTDVNLEVIPSSTATKPAAGDIFTYGAAKLTILTIVVKNVKKDVQKWTITGNRFPGVDLT